MRALSVVSALCVLAVSAPAQTTWYVDLAATPPGDGSQASPYVSIQQAIAAPTTVHGDTVLVAPGGYAETIDFGPKAITVRSSAGPLATSLWPGDPSEPVVTLGAQHDLGIPRLEGFTIRGDPRRGSGVGVRVLFQTIGGIRRCIVTGHQIGIENHYDAVIQSCTVFGNVIGIDDGSGDAGHHIWSSIVRGNSGTDLVPGHFFFTVLRYSDIGDAAEICSLHNCTGNVDVDPLFWDAPNGDVHLRPGSPCIDSGDPAELDPDGSRIDMGALTYDPFWAPGTGTSCFGDALTCPCGNGGSGDGGCDIPQATGGIELAIVNFAPNGSGGGTAQFLGSAYSPNGQPGSTLIRSPALGPAPVVFGDGLRCITAAGLVRVGALVASGGTSLHSISHGAGAGTFHYQVWVRSQPAGFCNPEAFNLSNVVSVTW